MESWATTDAAIARIVAAPRGSIVFWRVRSGERGEEWREWCECVHGHADGMTWLEVEGDVSAARQRAASARMCVMVWPRSSSCAVEQDVELQLDLRHPHPDPPMWATALPPLPSATEGGVCKPLTAHQGTGGVTRHGEGKTREGDPG